MAEMIILSGKHQGKKLSLPETEIVIGRDEQCHLRLASSDVSRQHCALRATPEGVVARDLGSRNGTFVNDVPIEFETVLHPGDVVRVGPLQLKVPGVKAGTKDAGDRPATRVPRKPRSPDDAASDDDIASWLSEDIPPGSAAEAGDTTIIPNRPPAAKAASTSEAPAVQEKPAPPMQDAAAKDKKKTRSIADEAADIIRRHHELKRKEG